MKNWPKGSQKYLWAVDCCIGESPCYRQSMHEDFVHDGFSDIVVIENKKSKLGIGINGKQMIVLNCLQMRVKKIWLCRKHN